jgi:hypothetical protein
VPGTKIGAEDVKQGEMVNAFSEWNIKRHSPLWFNTLSTQETNAVNI